MEARTKLQGDTEPLISEGLREETGQYGEGLVAKVDWHRETQIRISETDAKQGYLTRFMMENPNLEVRARVHATQKEMVMTVPHNSPSARPLLRGTVWFPRPFVARFALNATAVGTGKMEGLTEKEAIPRKRLLCGVASRPHVPVFHWTGYDNGEPREMAMILYFYTKGDHLPAAQKAGTIGGYSSLA